MDRERPDEALHEKLAGEGKHDNIEGHEGEVSRAFAIIRGRGRMESGGERDERVGRREGV